MAIDPRRSFLGSEFKRVYRQLTASLLPATKKLSATVTEFGIVRDCYELALLPVFAPDRATKWMLVGAFRCPPSPHV